jgi:type II secretory ATPase GspE/PulE/Tfp pilus assembly ATPase PilB-like protein
VPVEEPDDMDSARSAIAELVNSVVDDALRDGASDIHFEPMEDGLLVRFRVDGALYESRRVSSEQSSQLVRQLKVLAGMDIADTMRPQDGRLSVQHQGRNIDRRVSTLPLGGMSEKVVMRVLDSRVAARDLDVIGYTKRELAKVDPDVVLIGEMRDAETASIAVKASMTGHLVLSTRHASDALSTLDRLYGMDIDTGALAAALKGISRESSANASSARCAATAPRPRDSASCPHTSRRS